MPWDSKSSEHSLPMGDRSPKDTQKKTGQKQTKASSADQKKKQATASKQAVTKKK